MLKKTEYWSDKLFWYLSPQLFTSVRINSTEGFPVTHAG